MKVYRETNQTESLQNQNAQTLSVFNDDGVVMLFNRYLADKILAGEKTQTRRSAERRRGVKVYEVGDRACVQVGYRPPVAYVIIKNRRR